MPEGTFDPGASADVGATGLGPAQTKPGVYMGGGPWVPRPTPESVKEFVGAAPTPFVDVSGLPVAENPSGVEGTNWMRDPATGQKFVLLTQEDATNAFFHWDQKARDNFRMELSLAGNDNAMKMNDADLLAMWNQYVQLASQYSSAGVLISPAELIQNDIRSAEQEKKEPKTTLTTRTAFDITSPQDAEALFYQSARSLLGRAPTVQEIARFQDTLTSMEQAAPTVQTVEQTTSPEGDVSTEVVSETGGLDQGARQLAALKQAQANPEYGAYQAATTYMNAFKQLIFGRGY